MNCNLDYKNPAGNRVQKSTSAQGTRKYIVDVVGDLPVILMELDPADMSIKKCYIYANAEILSEHDGGYNATQYFYLHDRLGSVRQVITSAGSVVKTLTYNPFGETIEDYGSYSTPWQFTGQYLDSETNMYYLRARQYSPYLARFTGRDLIVGKFEDPMSLHRYLYCQNEPINRLDLSGLLYAPYGEGYYDETKTQKVLDHAIMLDKLVGFGGCLFTHGISCHDFKYLGKAAFDYKHEQFTFNIGGEVLANSEFGNYCAGYALYYDYGFTGLTAAFAGGQMFGDRWYGTSGGFGRDDYGSLFRIIQGAIDANKRAQDWFKYPFSNLGENPLLSPGTLNDTYIAPFDIVSKIRYRKEGEILEQLGRIIEIFKD